MAAESVAPVSVPRIRPLKGWMPLHLGELQDCRDLLRLLAWREIKVRYQQAALGAGWAVLQSLLPMAVLSLFSGRDAKVQSDGLPNPIFAFAALALLLTGAFYFRRMEATFANVV